MLNESGCWEEGREAVLSRTNKTYFIPKVKSFCSIAIASVPTVKSEFNVKKGLPGSWAGSQSAFCPRESESHSVVSNSL